MLDVLIGFLFGGGEEREPPLTTEQRSVHIAVLILALAGIAASILKFA